MKQQRQGHIINVLGAIAHAVKPVVRIWQQPNQVCSA